MRPQGLQSKIFLDSGDPAETKQLIELLGFLDGQTTNPTLVANNPTIHARIEKGEKFSEDEIYEQYKQVVSEISALIPSGSVSIEVYADNSTSPETMFAQGQEMFTWIPNAHVKYPIIPAGLASAEKSIAAGMRVNMTLCFTEEQAAAVYAATKGANAGDVFVSPFIGRLDDQGENGMSLITNIRQLYSDSDGHAQVLAASVRTMEHFMQSITLGAEQITAPFKVLKAWGEAGLPVPDANFSYDSSKFTDIPYKAIDLNQSWDTYDIHHELTDKGIDRFSEDWNSLIS